MKSPRERRGGEARLVGEAEQAFRIRVEHPGANQARTEGTRQSDLVNFEESAQGKAGR